MPGRGRPKVAKPIAEKSTDGIDGSDPSGNGAHEQDSEPEVPAAHASGKRPGGKGAGGAAKKAKGSKKDSDEGEKKVDSEGEASDSPENGNDDSGTTRIVSWNVSGIRAWLKKDGLKLLLNQKPDIIALQEIKCGKAALPIEVKNLPDYHCYWLDGSTPGYAGIGILSKIKPISVSYGIENKEMDKEGRIVTAEYREFYLVAAYIPNAGRELKTLPFRMEWDILFRDYLKSLDAKKPVILCGDLNVAHNEIDLANPKTNKRTAGFTIEERNNFTELLDTCNFVDTFRHFSPKATGAYTFWSYMRNSRAKNVGWRLDYFVASKRFLPQIKSNKMLSKLLGSDHCPIVLTLDL